MQRAHRKAHAWIWTVLAVALPVILALAFGSTSRLSADAPAIKLGASEGQVQP
jgi:hypothetical protein